MLLKWCYEKANFSLKKIEKFRGRRRRNFSFDLKRQMSYFRPSQRMNSTDNPVIKKSLARDIRSTIEKLTKNDK
jgi:hypothetical protein